MHTIYFCGLKLMLHRINRLNVLTSMGLLVVVKTCKDEHTIKGDWGGPAKSPLMTKLVSPKNKVPTLLEVKSQNAHTCLDLIQTDPYIENLGAVIGLVTSLRFVEISQSRPNVLNGYRSYNRWWKLSTYEEFLAMNMGLVTAPRFCGSNPPHTWMSLHPRISQVLCGCPCALPMDDSFVHRRSIWTFGSKHLDDPYGQTWDVIFTISSVAPSSNGCPKILLGFNAHLYGSEIFFFFLNLGHVSWLRWLTRCVNCVFQRDRHVSSSEWLASLRWPHFWAL